MGLTEAQSRKVDVLKDKILHYLSVYKQVHISDLSFRPTSLRNQALRELEADGLITIRKSGRTSGIIISLR